MDKITSGHVFVAIVAVEKIISNSCSECASVVSVIKHAKRMRRIVFCDLSGSTTPPLPHYLINDTILGKKSLNIKCVFIFSSIFSEVFLILRRIYRGIIVNVHRSSC
jgi:hypothetical protein